MTRKRRGYEGRSFCDIGWGQRMRKKHLEVYKAALKIAGSGNARDWKGIQDKLVDGGYPRAPEFLDSPKIRAKER